MSADDQLYDLVAEWDSRRQDGEEPSAVALCRERPDLLPALRDRIASIKATDWLLLPDDEEDDEFHSSPPERSRTHRVPATVSLEDFRARIVASRLLAADEIPEAGATDANDLANRLLRATRLTEYQVQQIAAGNTQGLVLGNYVILQKIGSGGMGTVFLARHRRMNRVVALKTISQEALDSTTAVERFRREVEAAARLNHVNIVAGYDADECAGTHFLVMEYVDGQDLWSLVKQGGRMPIGATVECICQAARGLEYAHQKGVIHRDIKPANLLLSRQGVVKILDMGLARLENPEGTDSFVAEQAALTADGTVLGTIDYLAPEQAVDTHAADARADIYSLGCTLYYLLAAEPMYGGGTLMAKMLAHRDRQIPSLCEARPDVTPQLVTIFEKMVAKRPDERYATMQALLGELDPVAAQYEGTWQWPLSAVTAAARETDVEFSARDTDRGDTSVERPGEETPAAPARRIETRQRHRIVLAGVVVGSLLLGLLTYWVSGILFRDPSGGLTSHAAAETRVELAGTDLVITDVNGGSTNDRFELATSEGSLTIKSGAPTHSFQVAGTVNGAEGHGTDCVTVPLSAFDSLVVNTLGGNDTIEVNGIVRASGVAADLVVDGGDGEDTVIFRKADTNLGAGDVQVTAETILVDDVDAGGVKIVTRGSIEMNAAKSIVVGPGSGIAVHAADANHGIRLKANVNQMPGDFIGIKLDGARVTTDMGFIELNGSGGTTESGSKNYGVWLRAGAVVSAGRGCPIDITGRGGTGSGEYHEGVRIQGPNAEIASWGGPVTVKGTGGGSGDSDYNVGVDVLSGRITARGSGTVTVCGKGGETAGVANHGVLVRLPVGIITSSGGDVLVHGTAGGGNRTYAVAVALEGAIGERASKPDVRIVAQGPVYEDEESRIVADKLGIDASDASDGRPGDVFLEAGPNDVNTLAVRADGDLVFRDTNHLTIGSVTAAGAGCCRFPETTDATAGGTLEVYATSDGKLIRMK